MAEKLAIGEEISIPSPSGRRTGIRSSWYNPYNRNTNPIRFALHRSCVLGLIVLSPCSNSCKILPLSDLIFHYEADPPKDSSRQPSSIETMSSSLLYLIVIEFPFAALNPLPIRNLVPLDCANARPSMDSSVIRATE